MGKPFQVQKPLSIFLGKRSMTGSNFREQGWQDTKMRKPGTVGVVGGSHAPSQQGPNARGRGQEGYAITWGWAPRL